MRAKYDKDGKIILMGDNTGGGAVMLRSVSFYSDGVWISTEPLVYARTADCVCVHLTPTCKVGLALDLPERNCYVCQEVSLMRERMKS
jgi:hypothetical protein